MGKDTEKIARRSIVLRGIIAVLDRLPWAGRLAIGIALALAILIVAVNFKGCSWGDFVITVDDSEEAPDIEFTIEQRLAPGAGTTISVERDEDGNIIEIRKGGPVEEPVEEPPVE